MVIVGVAAPGIGAGSVAGQGASELLIEGHPVVTAGRTPVVVWRSADVSLRAGVYAAVPPEEPGRRLGPQWPGDDGQPAGAAGADGSTWVLTSRSGGSRSRLWAQQLREGRWRRAERGPSAGRFDRHPALAAGGEALWAVWIASDGIGRRPALYASRRRHDGWSEPERLPQPSGDPMSPAIAVDDDGLPAVVWAADDGGHAEIWSSWRGRSGWRAPLALTADETPDVSPSIAVSGDRWVIAWSSFRQRGYWTEAVVGHPRQGWDAPRRVSRGAGSSPVALAAEAQLGVVWVVPESSPGSTRSVLRWSRLARGAWQRPQDMVVSANADIGAAVGADGRLHLGWTNLRGSLTVADSANALSRDRAPALRVIVGQTGDAVTADALPLPVVSKISSALRWLAFGDSITAGYTLVNGNGTYIPGYPDNLEARLLAVMGAPAQVFNHGVGGETTVAGVGRFSGALAGTAATGVVIMEGTNDISNGFATSVTAFNLRQMAAIAKAAGAATIIAAVLPRDEHGFGGSDNAATTAFNGMIPVAAAAVGASVVDTHTPFVGRSDLFSSSKHPTAAGYDFLGGLVFNAINMLVPGGGGGGTTAPGTPESLEAVVVGSTVAFSWVGATAGVAPTSYRVQAGSAPNGNDLADFDTGSASTSFTATNVGDATFNVTVRAVNTAGMSSQSNNVAVTVGGLGTCSAPSGAPASLTTAATGSSVTISWAAGPGEGANSYIIEAGSGTGLSDLASFDTGSTATTFRTDGVAAGTYFIRVRAVNACGVSAASTEAILIVP